MQKQIKIKASCINASSPFAEREITLTQIDNMWEAGEINTQEAKNMIIKWAVETKNTHLLPVLIGNK